MDITYMPASAVQTRYGISDMTLYRWLRDAKLGFPQPLIVRRRRLFRRDDLDKWDRARCRAAA
jgi:excisionase family DNA binding protein